MLLSEYGFFLLTSLLLSKVNALIVLFWENTNQILSRFTDFAFQWLLNVFSYCLLGDMFSWMENRARICEAVLLGSVALFIGKGKKTFRLSVNSMQKFPVLEKLFRDKSLGLKNFIVFVDDYFGMSSTVPMCGPSPGVEFQFGYRRRNGPAKWKEHYEYALGEMQSPINIVTCDTAMVRTSPLLWSNHDSVPELMIMHNDGYSVTIQGKWKCGKPGITVEEDNRVYYVFNRLYFHWGPTDTEGSEHTINYERYPLELHAIYLKEGYVTPMEAHYDKCPDGILIVAFLFEIAPVDNPLFLHTVTENLFKIRNPKSRCYIEPFPLSDIFPEFTDSYFKYDGSITQPPCSEIVKYVVQRETIAVSRRQMSMFRKLMAFDGKPMVNNSRPVQRLNRRTVYYCCQ